MPPSRQEPEPRSPRWAPLPFFPPGLRASTPPFLRSFLRPSLRSFLRLSLRPFFPPPFVLPSGSCTYDASLTPPRPLRSAPGRHAIRRPADHGEGRSAGAGAIVPSPAPSPRPPRLPCQPWREGFRPDPAPSGPAPHGNPLIASRAAAVLGNAKSRADGRGRRAENTHQLEARARARCSHLMVCILVLPCLVVAVQYYCPDPQLPSRFY